MARKKNDGMTKLEAVRQALSELGKDAMPTQIKGFVKERFGLEMTTDHISTAKSDIRRRAGGKGKSGLKSRHRFSYRRRPKEAASPASPWKTSCT